MTGLRAIARLTFHEGRLDDFKQLSAQVVEVVRAKDTGTLQYDLYLNEDETECVFLEHYEDSAAMIAHNANVGHLLGPMLATGTVTAELLGTPSDELMAMVAGAPVRVMTPLVSS